MTKTEILSKYRPERVIGTMSKTDVVDLLNEHFDCKYGTGAFIYKGQIRFSDDFYTLIFHKDSEEGYFVEGIEVAQGYLVGCGGIDWEFVGKQARVMDTAITRFLGKTAREIAE